MVRRVTRWTVRLRYLEVRADRSSWVDRRERAAWIEHVLTELHQGVYAPARALPFLDGVGVSLLVDAEKNVEAVLAASRAIGEVVGDVERVLGRLQSISTDPPLWQMHVPPRRL
jgi:hypothetical protein